MKCHVRRKHGLSRSGFTLLEVLLVLVILGVIAALVVPRLTGSQERALVMATQTAIKELEAKVELYAIEHDATYPETLDALVNPLDRDGKPMKAYTPEVPRDAWREPLNYELASDDAAVQSLVPRIWSNGPNRQNENGSGDDINNWATTEAAR
jgi:general secretion pathway protein G